MFLTKPHSSLQFLTQFLLANTVSSLTTLTPNCTVPHNVTNIVESPNTRGTYDIIKSCVFTLFILHMDCAVPEHPKADERSRWYLVGKNLSLIEGNIVKTEMHADHNTYVGNCGGLLISRLEDGVVILQFHGEVCCQRGATKMEKVKERMAQDTRRLRQYGRFCYESCTLYIRRGSLRANHGRTKEKVG